MWFFNGIYSYIIHREICDLLKKSLLEFNTDNKNVKKFMILNTCKLLFKEEVAVSHIGVLIKRTSFNM